MAVAVQSPASQHDEGDATPDEQLARHPVQWEERKSPGALHQVKETVVGSFECRRQWGGRRPAGLCLPAPRAAETFHLIAEDWVQIC